MNLDDLQKNIEESLNIIERSDKTKIESFLSGFFITALVYLLIILII